MKLVFVSNFINHYQVSFAEAMIRHGVDYVFVSAGVIPEDRIKLGFSTELNSKEYVLSLNDERDKVEERISVSDAVLCAMDCVPSISEFDLKGRPFFVVSERLFKPYDRNVVVATIKNKLRKLKYARLLKANDLFSTSKYLLIGKYAVEDYKALGVSQDRILNFAYFPASSICKREEKSDYSTINLLWVGRLINWKHPELAIHAYKTMKSLVDDETKVTLTVIGTGPMEKELIEMSSGLEVKLIGSVPSDKVRKYMQESDYYLFTSDYAEGWGCVLNEAMSEGCIPIASVQAGATPFLLEDGKNGFEYDGSSKDLDRALKKAVEHIKSTNILSENARKTIDEVWNADKAAENLICQLNSILHEGVFTKVIGPCSTID